MGVPAAVSGLYAFGLPELSASAIAAAVIASSPWKPAVSDSVLSCSKLRFPKLSPSSIRIRAPATSKIRIAIGPPTLHRCRDVFYVRPIRNQDQNQNDNRHRSD